MKKQKNSPKIIVEHYEDGDPITPEAVARIEKILGKMLFKAFLKRLKEKGLISEREFLEKTSQPYLR